MLKHFNPKVECEVIGHIEANNDEGKTLDVWEMKTLRTNGKMDLKLDEIQNLLSKKLRGTNELEMIYTPAFKEALQDQLKDCEWMETDVEIEVGPDREAFKMDFYPLGIDSFKDRYEVPYKIVILADRVRFELENGNRMKDIVEKMINQRLSEVQYEKRR